MYTVMHHTHDQQPTQRAPLIEEIDMAAAQQLYENFDRAHALSGSTAEPVQAFESYVNFFQAKLTGLEVDYDFAHGCFSGRRYSTTPSLQGVPKWIRDTIAGEIFSGGTLSAICCGMMSSVRRDHAVGASRLTVIPYFTPSSARQRMNPAVPAFAAP